MVRWLKTISSHFGKLKGNEEPEEDMEQEEPQALPPLCVQISGIALVVRVFEAQATPGFTVIRYLCRLRRE